MKGGEDMGQVPLLGRRKACGFYLSEVTSPERVSDQERRRSSSPVDRIALPSEWGIGCWEPKVSPGLRGQVGFLHFLSFVFEAERSELVSSPPGDAEG